MEEAGAVRKPIIVQPEQGRVYAMGQMRAVFKADADETAGRYSVSEWWLSPALEDRASTPTRMTTCFTSLPGP